METKRRANKEGFCGSGSMEIHDSAYTSANPEIHVQRRRYKLCHLFSIADVGLLNSTVSWKTRLRNYYTKCGYKMTVMACFHWAVRFGTARYGMQLCPFPLSEVVNGTKIANRTIPLFWYPFIGVLSTAKGTKRVELNSLQKLIGWLESSLVRDTRRSSFTRSALLCSAYYIRVRKHKNI